MHYLLRTFGNSGRNVNSTENLIKRAFKSSRSKKNERSNLIKVGVVGSGSFGDPASLVVKTCDNFVNVFNCGEGTFRMMYAKAYRFRYVSNVFCTTNRWDRVGGIPSLARAVFDRNSLFPTFHGPPQIETYLPKFAELTDLDPDLALTQQTFNHDNFYEDSYMEVDFIKLHSTNVANSKDSTVIAYVCRLIPRRGSVIVTKLTDNNIPIEFIKNINNGENFTLPDGRSIIASDYLTAGFSGGNFLIIDLPSSDYLHDLERNELLNEHLDEINSNLGMEFVAHFSSSDIVQTNEYQQFMRRINAKRHLALNDTNIYSGLKYVHVTQQTLNHLDDEMYPLLCSKFTAVRQTFTSLDSRDEEDCIRDPICIEPTVSGTRYIFPMSGKISKRELTESIAAENEDDSNTDTDSGEEDVVSDEMTESHTNTIRENIYPKVIFFGTGSSFPGTTKSVTSILVHTAPDASILLDCGEGTVGQMCRFYGSRTEEIIKNIKALHVTHMHGDHHMGIMDFIRIRQKYMPVNRKPILLMAPKKDFQSLLNFYEENFGDVLVEFQMIDNEDLISGGLTVEQKSLLKINDLKTCRVPHMEFSYAISIKSNILPENKDEFKLTFSGDTIPCDSLVNLGKHSTLLIHEATLEDTLTNSAAIKKHSTISQAIEQSEKMQAKYTILTHFSQRYRALPPINKDLIADKNIGIAFDNMEVVPNDLCKLNDIYFKLTETYAEDLERMEKRSQKYALRSDFKVMM